MLIPAISQLPLFVGTTMMLNNLSRAPSVFDSESFLTLTSLANADPTVTLPIVIGLISYANAESSRWFVSPQAAEREAQVEEWTKKKRAKGETVLQPRKILQTTLRIYSVARILVSAVFPGVRAIILSSERGLTSIRASSCIGQRPPRLGWFRHGYWTFWIRGDNVHLSRNQL